MASCCKKRKAGTDWGDAIALEADAPPELRIKRRRITSDIQPERRCSNGICPSRTQTEVKESAMSRQTHDDIASSLSKEGHPLVVPALNHQTSQEGHQDKLDNAHEMTISGNCHQIVVEQIPDHHQRGIDRPPATKDDCEYRERRTEADVGAMSPEDSDVVPQDVEPQVPDEIKLTTPTNLETSCSSVHFGENTNISCENCCNCICNKQSLSGHCDHRIKQGKESNDGNKLKELEAKLTQILLKIKSQQHEVHSIMEKVEKELQTAYEDKIFRLRQNLEDGHLLNFSPIKPTSSCLS